MISNKSVRISLAIGLIIVSAVFGLGPLLIKPEISTSVLHHYHRKEFIKYNEELHHHVHIYGSMTLNEVAEKYNIPVTGLASSINVPVEFANERLGRLRKQYGFQMYDLRKYINSKIEKNDR